MKKIIFIVFLLGNLARASEFVEIQIDGEFSEPELKRLVSSACKNGEILDFNFQKNQKIISFFFGEQQMEAKNTCSKKDVIDALNKKGIRIVSRGLRESRAK